MALSQADLDQFHGLLAAPRQKVAPKSKGNVLTHLLPTIGGTGGGVLGGAAGGALAGSVILPGVGTVAGGLLGALLGGAGGGALGKVAENKIEGNSLGQGVAGEAAMNGVLSAGPLRLLKGAGALTKGAVAASKGATPGLAESLIKTGVEDAGAPLKTSVAGKLDAFGNKQIGKSLFGNAVDKPTIRANDPAGTANKLFNMGLTKDTDVERTAHAITGSDGILNKAVATAVSKAGKLNTAEFAPTIESTVAKSGLVDSHAKALTNQIQATVNLIDPAKPESALKAMKALKARQQEYLGKGGTYHLPTSDDKLKAEVLNQVHDKIQNTLYKQAGADKNIAGVLTPDLEKQLTALHPDNPQWASHVKQIMQSKSVGDLRSHQAPFVNATKLIENGEGNAYSVGGRMVNNTSGLKGMFADAAANLVKQPAQRAAGIVAKKAASVAPGGTGTSGLLSVLSAPTKKSIVRNEALIGAPLSMMDGGQVSADSLDSGAPAQQSTALSPELMSGGSDQTQASNSPFDPANVQQGVQAILANGGKLSDVTAYVSLVKAMQDLGGSTGKAATPNATQQQQANNALSGLQSVQDIASTLQSNPNAAKLSALPGGSLTSALTGTGQYKAAIANAVDVIGRLRSGGAIGEQEQKQFKALLPQAFDSPDTAAYKLNQLQTLFNRFANPTAAASDLSTNGVAIN